MKSPVRRYCHGSRGGSAARCTAHCTLHTQSAIRIALIVLQQLLRALSSLLERASWFLLFPLPSSDGGVAGCWWWCRLNVNVNMWMWRTFVVVVVVCHGVVGSTPIQAESLAIYGTSILFIILIAYLLLSLSMTM